MIPMAMYELSESRHERKEKKIIEIICALIISFAITLLLVVGGFLLYLNQYDFISDYDYSQTQEDITGNATIKDGIHINDNILSNKG